MPLMYLPLIMYVGWWEFMFQPLRTQTSADGDVEAVADRRY